MEGTGHAFEVRLQAVRRNFAFQPGAQLGYRAFALGG
jgi:hypothetical protein